RKGLAIMAVSGVDLALWDLRGKRAGKPVAELLLEKSSEPTSRDVRRPIPMYLTSDEPLAPALRRGYRAFKLPLSVMAPEGDAGKIAELVATARGEIGEESRLMVDAFMGWNVEQTQRVAEAIQPYDVDWIEEPLLPDDMEGYAALSASSPIPIAGGEHEYTAAGFDELIARRLHHVLQPDVCWCGGMTELVKIYRAAREAGLRVCPHRGSEPWSLHAIAALDPDPLAESGRPWMTWIQPASGKQPTPQPGFARLSAAPGFGIQVDETEISPA
ncbi:MAG: hypothetical protein N2C14_04575, partial [Planctomycetales bacterium]